MSRRPLTEDEEKAYEELARAAQNLQEAQRAAEEARRREAEAGASLSLDTPPQRGERRRAQ